MKKKNQTSKVQAAPAPVVETPTPTNHQVKREQLKKLSAELKPLVESGEFKTINSAILASYKSDTHQTFKSFDEWKSEGFTVKKGEKSFCIWGKPIARENGEESYELFPILHLFSNAQVEASAK